MTEIHDRAKMVVKDEGKTEEPTVHRSNFYQGHSALRSLVSLAHLQLKGHALLLPGLSLGYAVFIKERLEEYNTILYQRLKAQSFSEVFIITFTQSYEKMV